MGYTAQRLCRYCGEAEHGSAACPPPRDTYPGPWTTTYVPRPIPSTTWVASPMHSQPPDSVVLYR